MVWEGQTLALPPAACCSRTQTCGGWFCYHHTHSAVLLPVADTAWARNCSEGSGLVLWCAQGSEGMMMAGEGVEQQGPAAPGPQSIPGLAQRPPELSEVNTEPLLLCQAGDLPGARLETSLPQLAACWVCC